MLIALDYDDTYTADTKLWDHFIVDAVALGHEVICVSCRRRTEENLKEVVIPGLKTYLTGLKPKREYMENLGINVHVWIDDVPESVKEGR